VKAFLSGFWLFPLYLLPLALMAECGLQEENYLAIGFFPCQEV
jgi:hypothetical protein